MQLTDSLISKFVKATNTQPSESAPAESHVYGTVTSITKDSANKDVYNVQLDGATSENITPVHMTGVQVKQGDRVNVLMKERTPQITDNLTNKVVNADYLEGGNAKFKGRVEADSGYFNGELRAATGTFKGSLQAASGSFAGSLSAATGTFTGKTQFSWYLSGNPWANVYIGDSSRLSPIQVTTPEGFVSIDPDGVIVSNGANKYSVLYATGVFTMSDERAKTDIADADPEIAKKLHPVNYRYIDGTGMRYGFIAQEVEKILPSAVQDISGRLVLNYTDLIAPISALLLEHEKRIVDLENRISELKGEIDELKNNRLSSEE